MKITKIELVDLPIKHYSTDVLVTVENEGEDYEFKISILGCGPKPSYRELERGWEPDWGMDHVESDIHLFLAQRLMESFWGRKIENSLNNMTFGNHKRF